MRRILAGLTLSAGLGLVGMAGMAPSAFAATTCGNYGQVTCPNTSNNGGTPTATDAPNLASQAPAASSVASPTTSTSSNSGLAFTGADVAGTVTVGVILIGGGVAAVRFSRRRHATN